MQRKTMKKSSKICFWRSIKNIKYLSCFWVAVEYTEIYKLNRVYHRYWCNKAENAIAVLSHLSWHLALSCQLLHTIYGLCQMRHLDGRTHATKLLQFSASSPFTLSKYLKRSLFLYLSLRLNPLKLLLSYNIIFFPCESFIRNPKNEQKRKSFLSQNSKNKTKSVVMIKLWCYYFFFLLLLNILKQHKLTNKTQITIIIKIN